MKLKVYGKSPRVTKGFVVKREWSEECPLTKRPIKHRVEISRVFHVKSAAQTFMEARQERAP